MLVGTLMGHVLLRLGHVPLMSQSSACTIGSNPFHRRWLVAEEPVVKHVASASAGVNKVGTSFAVFLEDGVEGVCLLPEDLDE